MKRVFLIALALLFLICGAAEAVELEFLSFDGGGRVYTVEVEDPSVVAFESRRDYGANHDELETGSPYRQIITLTGLKPGATRVTIHGDSPIAGNEDTVYMAAVDEDLNVTLASVREITSFFLYRSSQKKTWRIARGPEGYLVSVNDEADQSIDGETVDALMRIIDEYDLAGWDGFSGSRHYGPHDESFWLEIRLTDGASVQARGEGVYPENYQAAMDLVRKALDGAVISPAVPMEILAEREEQTMKIRVSDGTHTVLYQLNDSGPAASLYQLLPIEAEVENYGRNEKIFYPKRSVETADGVEGGGEAGGLALFSPWGNVVMYYDRFNSYPGLYILGEAIEGVDQVKELSGTIRVERVD